VQQPGQPVPDTSKDKPWPVVGAAVDGVKRAADQMDLGLSVDLAKGLTTLGLTVDTQPGPAPTLKRPVVMIPGFTMDASSYDPMAQHLASGAGNGGVVVYTAADGKFHAGSANGPPADPKTAKIFEIQYSNPMAPSTEKAIEIGNALRAIQGGATPQMTFDVVAHSAGCTDFRQYLEGRSPEDQAAVGIGEAILVGPASHGTFMGNIGESPLGKPLGVQAGGAELALGADEIQQLNSTWDHQRSQVQGDLTIVGVSGAPTPGPGGVSSGDGFMPLRDLAMPNA
jgi:pimeloyl-ACP methyl ester carboxylesterase